MLKLTSAHNDSAFDNLAINISPYFIAVICERTPTSPHGEHSAAAIIILGNLHLPSYLEPAYHVRETRQQIIDMMASAIQKDEPSKESPNEDG